MCTLYSTLKAIASICLSHFISYFCCVSWLFSKKTSSKCLNLPCCVIDGIYQSYSCWNFIRLLLWIYTVLVLLCVLCGRTPHSFLHISCFILIIRLPFQMFASDMFLRLKLPWLLLRLLLSFLWGICWKELFPEELE